MTPVRCPSCRSLDVREEEGGFLCQSCRTRLRREGDVLVAVNGSGGRFGLVAVGGLALVLVLLGAWVVGRTLGISAPPSEQVVQTPPSTEVAPPVASGPAAAAVVDVRDAATLIGGHYWLMTYRNTGGVPIATPAVTVRLLDEAGAVLKELSGDAAREQIAPGESVPAFVMAGEAPKFARAEVLPVEPRPADGPAWKVSLPVEGLAHKDQALGSKVVVGMVVNNTGRRARFVSVHVVGVDAEGRPVSWASAPPTVSDMEPGQKVPFSARMGIFEVEAPVRFEAYAQANLK